MKSMIVILNVPKEQTFGVSTLQINDYNDVQYAEFASDVTDEEERLLILLANALNFDVNDPHLVKRALAELAAKNTEKVEKELDEWYTHNVADPDDPDDPEDYISEEPQVFADNVPLEEANE